MNVKKIGFVGIPVTDVSRAREFYEGVLGLRVSETMMAGKWVEFAVGDDTLAIANVGETWASWLALPHFPVRVFSALLTQPAHWKIFVESDVHSTNPNHASFAE